MRKLITGLLFWALVSSPALADGFPSGQSPPGTPSQGVVPEILINGVAIPVSIANPLPVTGGGGGSGVTSITCGTGLSGGTITTTGTCSLSTSNTSIGPFPLVWDNNTTVQNSTTTIMVVPWTSGTIASVTALTNGSGTPSFTADIKIGGTDVTGCSAISVSSSSATTTSCTGANTLASGSVITAVISSVSGTPNNAYVGINIAHTAN